MHKGQEVTMAKIIYSDYEETEEKHFIASKSWTHCLRSWHEMINVRLSDETVSTNKDAAIKFTQILRLINITLHTFSMRGHFYSFTLLCKVKNCLCNLIPRHGKDYMKKTHRLISSVLF